MSKEKIFIISGEDSGDLHGAKLIASIKQINPKAEFFGIGEEVPETKIGRMILFPSTMPHRARKVTKGTRYSLVMWGHRQ